MVIVPAVQASVTCIQCFLLLALEHLQCNSLSNAHQHGRPQSFLFANQALRSLHQGQIDFKLIQYDVWGKFLGWQDVKGATLQLCPNSQKVLDAAFLLGTTYSQSCTLEVSALLQRTPEPIFYEMFLQFEDEKGNTQLWPIPISSPIMVTNNQGCKVSLLKPSLFQQSVEMQTPMCLQQALSISAMSEPVLLSFVHCVESTAPEPLLKSLSLHLVLMFSTIAESSAPEILSGRWAIKQKREFVKCSRVCYPGKGFDSQISFCTAVNTNIHCIDLADMSLCWYPKYPCVRSCPEAQEAAFILLAFSSSSSPALLPSEPTAILLPGFCSVHLPTTVPGEDPPFFLTVRYATYPLAGAARVSFSVSYIQRPGSAQLATDIAFGVLGFLAVLYALLETSSWARRSRLQNIGFTTILKFFACLVGSLANVFFMVTLGIGIYWLIAFKVVGLKNLASRDLNVSLQPEPNTYQAPWSPILRFGIAASVWLVVAIVQMLVSVGLYQRFVEDKIHQFIDLCSLSNVSHIHHQIVCSPTWRLRFPGLPCQHGHWWQS
ncbi:hypothetical protein Chor_004891 [Crotalus horridus]